MTEKGNEKRTVNLQGQAPHGIFLKIAKGSKYPSAQIVQLVLRVQPPSFAAMIFSAFALSRAVDGSFNLASLTAISAGVSRRRVSVSWALYVHLSILAP